MIKKYREVGNMINDLIKVKVNNGYCDTSEYQLKNEKVRIKNNMNNYLPPKRPLIMYRAVILIRFLFKDDGTYHPHIFLEKCLQIIWIDHVNKLEILLSNKK